MPTQTISGKLLFIGAHPDDIEIACGGTAAKCVARAQQIAFAIASCEIDVARAKKRELEATKAAKLLNLSQRNGNLFFGNLPDTQLHEKQKELRDWMKGIAGAFNPDTVFVHRLDKHTDHQAVHQVAIGVFQANNVFLYKVPRPSPDDPFTPNHVEDISDFITTTIALCKCHTSQDPIYVSKDSVETNSHQCFIEWYGRHNLKSKGYAEGFIIHASRSILNEVTRPDKLLPNYNVRVIKKADGTLKWED